MWNRLPVGCRGALVVVVLLASIGTAAAQPRPVALINGDSIFLDEVEAELKRLPLSVNPLIPSQQKALRMQILTGLIDDMLLRQFFKANGPQITQDDIVKQFALLEASQKTQNKTMADFYRETQQSEAQVKSNMTVMLQMIKYTKDRASDAEVQKYFDTNKDYFDKVTVRASHVVLRVSASTSQDDRVKSMAKLKEVRAEIAAGKLTFTDAAKENSQCPSAPRGGDVGFFARKGVLDENFARAAFAMKVGDLSEVVETDFGYHLISVTDRSPGNAVKLEQVIEEVREQYMEDFRVGIIAQQRKSASISISLQ